MPSSNEKTPYITKGFIISILLVIVFAASGLIIADTRGSVKETADKVSCLEKDKIDRTEHYANITALRTGQENIVKALNSVTIAIAAHDPNVAKFLHNGR